MADRTVVHLIRHGEVDNPTGVLYGRLAGYVLSDLGHQMAETTANFLAGNDIAVLISSPLERAQQTAAPLADRIGLKVQLDERVIEADNQFEGKTVGVGAGAFSNPRNWWMLRNPWRPSWGEPYRVIAARMQAAIADARDQARGHEVAIVSHQLPVWIARQSFEGNSFPHDPRKRQCTLASVTSLAFEGDTYVGFEYVEPAAHLLPENLDGKFVGGA